ncbi:hypothetical protein ABPG72_000667 [Tetrahymena utriculariae]
MIINQAISNQQQLNLFTYDMNQNLINLQLDSIFRLSIALEIDQQQTLNCPICLDEYSNILRNQHLTIMMLNCHHILCKRDFQNLMLSQKDSVIKKCPICRQRIHSAFVLCEDENNIEWNKINLTINDYLRFDLDFLGSVFCFRNCGRKAMVNCGICNRVNSQFCLDCINVENKQFVRDRYLKTIFYCGCQFQLNLFQLINKNPTFVQLFVSTFHTDPEKFQQLLQTEMKAITLQQIANQNLLFCPDSPLRTFKTKSQIKKHLRDCHLEIYIQEFPESELCCFCKKFYANNNMLKQHQNGKCKFMKIVAQQYFQ